MATDQWLEFGGVELINLSRTAQLAEVLGIDTVWTDPASVQWVQNAFNALDYDVITTAPWYDAGYPASAEFAGLVPLSVVGLDDSTLEAATTEYITDGGSSGSARNKTLPLVFNVAIVASTAQGAEFGKRWLSRVLKGSGAGYFCAGSSLKYFRWEGGGSETAHRRNVSLTRAPSVTRKRATHCSVTWLVTFTLTANDPFEYSDELPQFQGLGGGFALVDTSFIGAVEDSGTLTDLVEIPCAEYIYAPVYDPLYPALLPPPTAPDFYPEGWALLPGVEFTRHWVRLNPTEPTTVNLVPLIYLKSDYAARMVRVSIWPGDAATDVRCGPLWTAIVSYLPGNADGMFILDGEQSAAYVWDGDDVPVRRADSLVFGTDAKPMDWAAFNDDTGLLVTLDYAPSLAETDGGDSIEVAVSFMQKSD